MASIPFSTVKNSNDLITFLTTMDTSDIESILNDMDGIGDALVEYVSNVVGDMATKMETDESESSWCNHGCMDLKLLKFLL